MYPARALLRWGLNPRARQVVERQLQSFSSAVEVGRARDFHRSLPGYFPTPLVELRSLALELGLNSIMVKDESERFGLQAFKVLGASYAVSRALSERFGHPDESLPFTELRHKIVQQWPNLRLATATDGNHGRALAWVARQLGVPATVYLPAGSTAIRVERIQQEGAQTEIIAGNYDEAVRRACKQAHNEGWLLVQDTGWPGYEDIPRWIMQGYTTLIDEAYEQSKSFGKGFTHVCLQAGVGSFAGAVQGCLYGITGAKRPVNIVLEPFAADCLLRSSSATDGKPRENKGSLRTIMAGLACGRPNPMAWEVLRDLTDCFVACDDSLAALGMRVLGNPALGDQPVVSGESGAIGIGFLYTIMKDPAYEELRRHLNLGPAARVLTVSTEGNTDPAVYRSVVWDGLWPRATVAETKLPSICGVESSECEQQLPV